MNSTLKVITEVTYSSEKSASSASDESSKSNSSNCLNFHRQSIQILTSCAGEPQNESLS